MKSILLILALIAAPSFATYGNGGNQVVAAHEQLVVDAYMDVNAAHCYDSADQLVQLANKYAAGNQQVVVRVNAANHANDVVRFQRRVVVRSARNVRFVVVRSRQVAAVRGGRTVVVVRQGRRTLLNRVFFGGFNRAARQNAEVVIERVRF